MSNSIEVSERFKAARKSKGLSQQELSDITGISVVTISQLENAKKNFSLGTLVNMANALETTVNTLLDGKSNVKITNRDVQFNKLISSCNDDQREMVLETVSSIGRFYDKRSC